MERLSRRWTSAATLSIWSGSPTPLRISRRITYSRVTRGPRRSTAVILRPANGASASNGDAADAGPAAIASAMARSSHAGERGPVTAASCR
jgi:hypothetical protein